LCSVLRSYQKACSTEFRAYSMVKRSKGQGNLGIGASAIKEG
jgi:hypothetical protein